MFILNDCKNLPATQLSVSLFFMRKREYLKCLNASMSDCLNISLSRNLIIPYTTKHTKLHRAKSIKNPLLIPLNPYTFKPFFLYLQKKHMLKITLLVIGKTTDAYIKQGIQIYTERLKHYCTFSILEIPELQVSSKISQSEIKKKEGEILLSKIPKQARVYLLDERGTQYTSKQFSTVIDTMNQTAIKEVYFVVGGAFGFSDEVYTAFPSKVSISAMTFSHQMIRLFFVEQIYRAFSIIHNLPYHHE